MARALTWTRHEYVVDQLDPFNQMLAVLETQAHLDVLHHQQRIVCEMIDGVRHCAPA